jgi:hypothetical protein
LVGINEDKIEIIQTWILIFSITVLLKQKNIGFVWMFTSVYGPNILSLRNIFWQKLRDIRSLSDVTWLVGGDFNVVRSRQERKRRTFNHSISNKFNLFINNNHLIDLKTTDRSFTWTNFRISPSFACLDRFLCTTSWESEFPNYISKSLPRYQSDHNAIILFTDNLIRMNQQHNIKYDKNWPQQEGFNELMITWWKSIVLDITDIGNSWKVKL